MGIAVNLVTYLMGVMHLPSSTAANTVTDFMGTSFLLCLLGGFLADSFLGRYKTIGIFSAIQTLVSYITNSFKFHLYSAEHLSYLGDQNCEIKNETEILYDKKSQGTKTEIQSK